MTRPRINWPCAEPCEHGGICTLPHGHDGDHESHGTNGKIYCTWKDPR